MADIPELVNAVTNLVSRMGDLIDKISINAATVEKLSKQQIQIINQLNQHSEMLMDHEHRISRHTKCRNFEPHDPHGETSALHRAIPR
jgi:TolA-binding protein